MAKHSYFLSDSTYFSGETSLKLIIYCMFDFNILERGQRKHVHEGRVEAKVGISADSECELGQGQLSLSCLPEAHTFCSLLLG